MTNPYVPLLIMSAAALVLAFGGLVASAILGPTKKSTTKADNYERYPADQRSPHRGPLPGALLAGRDDLHHLRH